MHLVGDVDRKLSETSSTENLPSPRYNFFKFMCTPFQIWLTLCGHASAVDGDNFFEVFRKVRQREFFWGLSDSILSFQSWFAYASAAFTYSSRGQNITNNYVFRWFSDWENFFEAMMKENFLSQWWKHLTALGINYFRNDFGAVTTTKTCVFVRTLLIFWTGNFFEVFGGIFLRCFGIIFLRCSGEFFWVATRPADRYR